MIRARATAVCSNRPIRANGHLCQGKNDPPPGASGSARLVQRKKAPEGAAEGERREKQDSRQPPQIRIGPQSICTKFEPEYLPTPPALHEAAARAICATDRP